jgi:thiol-disulfide isomerase/thioredoxin
MTIPRQLIAAATMLVLVAAGPRSATVFDLSDHVGKAAPAVSLVAVDGTSIALNVAGGEPTYVFLFAGWCGPCQQELPFVRSAYAKFGDRVRFVGVDVLEDAGAAKAAVSAAALEFPVAVYSIEQLDAVVPAHVQLYESGAKYRIPAGYLIDVHGVVRYAWHGLAIDNAGLPVDVLPSYLAKLGVAEK